MVKYVKSIRTQIAVGRVFQPGRFGGWHRQRVERDGMIAYAFGFKSAGATVIRWLS